ncbi:hypothetical protein [Flavobacterium sp. 7A]|uniref:hypothetical protein n=1 Tax=Flavobacterium sp. 7A TaxID=2940571 RepID=UPI002226981F|nr:hypothetical protein [Flavobacterium sp. 7A]MCW2121198.1 hypothetical protein [Flavobacterium sp. 7A]
MKTTEFKKLIIQTENVEWFNSIEINLNFLIININQKFTGLASLHRFVEEQNFGWGKIEKIPQELLASQHFFDFIRQQIEVFINTYSNIPESTILDSYFRNPISEINARNVNIFTFDSLETDFLLKVKNTNPLSFLGAFTYLCGDLNQNMNQKDNFNGYLIAYEFKSKDSKISERLNSEKHSLRGGFKS